MDFREVNMGVIESEGRDALFRQFGFIEQVDARQRLPFDANLSLHPLRVQAGLRLKMLSLNQMPSTP